MDTLTGRIVSLQVSLPQIITTASGKEWKSAIAKKPVDKPILLSKENLEGDYQANRKYHGGPDKALCGYSAEHFPYWNEILGTEMPYGAFGENITVADLTEDVLCIGDILEIGSSSVQIQISQPRQPCSNVSKRWNQPSLPRRMEETGWTGFYARVISGGEVAPDARLTLKERPHPDWTILRANRLMYGKTPDLDEIAALRELQSLSAEWKRILGRKIARL
jgi:MOSC domain-containing protein YiiM